VRKNRFRVLMVPHHIGGKHERDSRSPRGTVKVSVDQSFDGSAKLPR